MLQKLPTGLSGASSAAVFNSPGSQLNSVCAFSRKVCVQKPFILLKVLAGSRAWTPSWGCFRLRWVQLEPCYSGACPHEIAPPRNMGTQKKPQVPTFPSLASMVHPSRYGCQGPLACLGGLMWQAWLGLTPPDPWRRVGASLSGGGGAVALWNTGSKGCRTGLAVDSLISLGASW